MGDQTDCNNYRSISLLVVCYKIMTILIRKRLKLIVEPQIGENQAGFRKGRGTTSQIFTMKETITPCYKYKIPSMRFFINSYKAYNLVKRSKLLETMEDLLNITVKTTRTNVVREI